MIYSINFMDMAAKINSLAFAKYLKETGWNTYVTKKTSVRIFQYIKGDIFEQVTIPIILGLLIIPENEKEWTKWSKEELMIKGCMYWLSLAGKDETANKANVTIKIDKHNVINSETLLQIFNKIAEEEDL